MKDGEVEPKPPATYSDDASRRIAGALVSAGIDVAVLLPDSVLHGVHRVLLAEAGVMSVVCSREDEGIAIGIGAGWTGRRPAVLMEGSGLGYSGLILARAMAQRSGVLLVASHNSALGERFSYHAATRLVAEPMLRALAIPSVVLSRLDDVETTVRELVHTMAGQRIPVALLVPRHICVEA